jgi:hypothetical protein
MTTLHTFGCSITQGFALPDVVQPILDEKTGLPLTAQEIQDQAIKLDWNKIHLYQPSQLAWPQVLGDRLGMPVKNYARRGACFQQIARQCAVEAPNIKPDDVVIVMWTYMSRLSLQWPARTAVPFCNIVDPIAYGWRTVILGFNKFFGLSPSDKSTDIADAKIQKYIETATQDTYLDPMGVYNHYYNNLVLQSMTDGFLRATGARVIHLSVEPQSSLEQLERARQDLDPSLQDPYVIPNPESWYKIPVDHASCQIILDPNIPTAENDMHPSVLHHSRFAEYIHEQYFQQ